MSYYHMESVPINHRNFLGIKQPSYQHFPNEVFGAYSSPHYQHRSDEVAMGSPFSHGLPCMSTAPDSSPQTVECIGNDRSGEHAQSALASGYNYAVRTQGGSTCYARLAAASNASPQDFSWRGASLGDDSSQLLFQDDPSYTVAVPSHHFSFITHSRPSSSIRYSSVLSTPPTTETSEEARIEPLRDALWAYHRRSRASTVLNNLSGLHAGATTSEIEGHAPLDALPYSTLLESMRSDTGTTHSPCQRALDLKSMPNSPLNSEASTSLRAAPSSLHPCTTQLNREATHVPIHMPAPLRLYLAPNMKFVSFPNATLLQQQPTDLETGRPASRELVVKQDQPQQLATSYVRGHAACGDDLVDDYLCEVEPSTHCETGLPTFGASPTNESTSVSQLLTPGFEESAEESNAGEEVEVENLRRPPRRDRAKDRFLVEKRQAGVSYRNIQILGGFTEAVSTLRGRYRTLTKGQRERVRRPQWTERDLLLLDQAVANMAYKNDSGQVLMREGAPVMTTQYPWGKVADFIVECGGSYRFGAGTCKKRWIEVYGPTQ